MSRWAAAAGRTILVVLSLILLGASTAPSRGPAARLHRYTAPLEFDFFGWTVDAAARKLGQYAVASTGYLPPAARVDLVRRWFRLIDEADALEGEIAAAFAGATSAAGTKLREDDLRRMRLELSELQPVAEAVLAEQAALTLQAEGLAWSGAFPPVSFRLSRLPVALVVSPRDVIRQDALIQLDPGMPLQDQADLESRVESGQDVSALVVPVGGIGTYPTMVQETGALSWVAEVILHEWTHNLLTLRPLGWNYETTPELRTMNETTAQLVGQALGRRLLERYYPDLVPAPAPGAANAPSDPRASEPPAFDFHAEMHATRVRADELLAGGKIAEAEAYMEERRQVFVANGYFIRRLNQAYFAFYGAYADAPQGAAGEDPVGAAVRGLWNRSESVAAFVRQMAWMDSFEDLERALGSPVTSR